MNSRYWCSFDRLPLLHRLTFEQNELYLSKLSVHVHRHEEPGEVPLGVGLRSFLRVS